MNVKSVCVLFVSAGMAFASIGPACAQSPVGNSSQPVRILESPPAPGAVRTAEGRWYMPVTAVAQSGTTLKPMATQSSGGPDDYGYTWDDSVAYNWIDAQGGTDTGLSQGEWDAAVTSAINLGFTFKFYEQSYSQIYISSAGVAGFDRNSLVGTTGTYYVPSPSKPNNMIAPFLTILRVNSRSYTGHIYYLRGGSAPNRYFVMQWHQVHDTDSNSSYTFQAILYENGTIDFSYQNVTYVDYFWCGSATAIENATGFDGLTYLQTAGCNDMRPLVGKTVRFYRPAPSARVSVWPKVLGAFAAPGNVVQTSMQIRNLGELGADTYDISASSLWPVAFYQADGVTPLADTNSDGTVDTGSIAQGAAKTIIVQTRVPASAAAGDSDRAQLSVWPASAPAYSRGVTVQVAVPAPFIQSDVRGGQPGLVYNQVGWQNTATVAGAANSLEPATTTTPAGNIVQVWSTDRTNANHHPVRELYFAIRDRYGNSVRAATKLTDYSSATLETYDRTPGIAVASDGTIAIVWSQLRWNPSNSSLSSNIYYMLLNSAGNVIASATNLSGNSQSPVTNLYHPSVAAVSGNRFVIAWSRQQNVNSTLSETVIYAVRASSGSAMKPPTEFSGSNNTCSKHPNLTPLADGSALLIYEFCSQVNMGRIDNAGNITLGSTAVPTLNGDYPDAVQLPNGNIVIATSVWWLGAKQSIEYVVINSGNSLVKSATDLSGISLSGDDFVSITRAGQRAVLTWEDSCSCGYQPNLYYALLDETGEIVTSPMIFTSDAGYALGVPYNGQGNTYLPPDTTVPANPTSLSSPSHRVNDWSNDNTIQATWYGAGDADSGVDGYSVVWDHSPTTLPGASKVLEQDVNTVTSAALADGTWYFHIRTVDNAGNWAASAVHLGPFMIDTAGPQARGRVTNNRGEPVLNALVTSDPPAKNTARSDLAGDYTLFYTTTGIYTLTVQRNGFGEMQALNGLTVNGIVSDVNLVLPPQVDTVSDGAFETPVPSAWTNGAQISATVEVSAAHTGQYGLDLQSHPALGLSVAALDTSTCVTQSVVISANWQRPTLSWMSHVVTGSVAQALVVSLVGTTEISRSVALTLGGWAQGWLDASPLRGQTATLGLCFADPSAGQQVYVDEVSLGESWAGALRIYLPQVRR